MWSENAEFIIVHTKNLQSQKQIMGKLVQKYYIFTGLVLFKGVNFNKLSEKNDLFLWLF